MKTYIPISTAEKNLILSGDKSEPLRVLQTSDEQDLIVLRADNLELDPKDTVLKELINRMLQTVTDENKPGVGIAAPQIGINRRVFLAQRLDKPEQPFEFFVNPEIVWYSKILRKGEEGCLSIAEAYDTVYRSYAIQITYFDLEGKHFQEVVEGFTAVIMQHEMDHLNGILFTDHVEEQREKEYEDASTKNVLVYLK
ncbi:peptide deformylase [Myroides guanonis]|uniref:Peptide deformylase n=1 Tax=Myroides guanonis TaxID=1150112 RepID=A0A1I3NBX0_9FLAO|nr:peptide deformylase [Myroides guanonis]SFJ06744.1 peptide deformylase [Myroides guanonis]